METTSYERPLVAALRAALARPKKHPGACALLIGSGGVALEDFFAEDPRTWLDEG